MTEYPIWSGINSDWVNSTEINGAAPTPLIVTSGFDSSQIPVLMGAYPGLYFEVMRVHSEQRAMRVLHETKDFILPNEGRDMVMLPENRAMSVERSRKRYP